MINFLSLKSFFEQNQAITILLFLGAIVLVAYYIKKRFPNIFENKENLKSQEEINKEEFEQLIVTESKKEEVHEDVEEETYFFNNENRDKLNKLKDKK